MKPVIGITVSMENNDKLFVDKGYADAIIQGGGIPLLLPLTDDNIIMTKMCDSVDGLLLTGGVDVDPYFFEEDPLPGLGDIAPERDGMELSLIKICLEQEKPILGICRGCQMLNVALGGDLYQDLTSQKQGIIKHRQGAPGSYPTHAIEITPDSVLYRITQKAVVRVNSFHHQSVRKVAPLLCASAKSKDCVIEAVERKDDGPFLLGVQWHPERMIHVCEDARAIFNYFIQRCKA